MRPDLSYCIMPVESLRTRIRVWLQDRTPFDGFTSVLTRKAVPQHGYAVWYYLGSMVLTCLAILIITGLLLAFYYQPYVTEDPAIPGAHESVQRIVNDLPHGWWIRSIHHWTAHLMIMALIVHFMSTLLLKAYRRPRELIWWSGLLLLALSLGSAFTGYLLPWNALSFAATRVGAGIVAATPLAGPLLRELLLGGPDVTGATLTRFYGLHVTLLPLLILAVVGIHIGLIVYQGSSVPPSVERWIEGGDQPKAVRFWPEFVYREARTSVLLFAALATVAFLFPPVLGARADPLAPSPVGIKPEWYFLAFFKALKLLPTEAAGLKNIQLALIAFGLIGAVVVLLPLLDTNDDARGSRRRRARRRGSILLLSSLGLTWAAALAPVSIVSRRFGLVAENAGASSSILWVPVSVGILVAMMGILLYRMSLRHPRTPATALGTVLMLVWSGYTLWEAFGPAIAGVGTLLLALLIAVTNRSGVPRARPALGLRPSLATASLTALLVLTVPLGRAHEGHSVVADTRAPTSAAEQEAVPAERREASAGRFGALMVVTAFLLWGVDRRVRYQRRLREAGMTG